MRELHRFMQDLREHIDGPAVCCGGYIRDAVAGREQRDLDIYIKETDYAFAANYLGGDFVKSYGTEWAVDTDSDEYRHQSVACQYEGKPQSDIIKYSPHLDLEQHPINLIGLRQDRTVTAPVVGMWIVQRFNIGISQFWMDEEGFTRCTDRARDDLATNTITVLREDWGVVATKKSVEKLLAKYGGFTAKFQDGTPYSFEEALRREKAAHEPTDIY